MSYDLMVFDIQSAPKSREDFMEWYDEQTEWEEEHGYDDPIVSTENLKNFFLEIINKYPAMNVPYASDDYDDPKVTDYSVGKEVIYCAFSWSESENAYACLKELAKKHALGFFDVSSEVGEIWLINEKMS